MARRPESCSTRRRCGGMSSWGPLLLSYLSPVRSGSTSFEEARACPPIHLDGKNLLLQFRNFPFIAHCLASSDHAFCLLTWRPHPSFSALVASFLPTHPVSPGPAA